MKTNRRHFLKTAGLGAGALGLRPQTVRAADAAKPPSFLTQPAKMKLGTVTYNLAQDWDIATLIPRAGRDRRSPRDLAKAGH